MFVIRLLFDFICANLIYFCVYKQNNHAKETNMKFMGFEGITSGYFIIFSICAVAYLIGWIVMKRLVPKYEPITDL